MKTALFFTKNFEENCEKVKPVVEDMIKDGYPFEIINIDTEKWITNKLNVKAVPMFILFVDNQEKIRITGAKTREELDDFINFEKFLNAWLEKNNDKLE
jgi:thioredoxin-like negative regulator of GroEL